MLFILELAVQTSLRMIYMFKDMHFIQTGDSEMKLASFDDTLYTRRKGAILVLLSDTVVERVH